MKKRIPLLSAFFALVATSVWADFAAYNDCAMSTSSPTNVTSWQSQNSVASPVYTPSGLLVDFTNGVASGVTCTASASGALVLWTDPVVNTPFAAGTDAANYFNGQLDFTGSPELNSASEYYQYTFTGLDTNKTYEFVTTMNRNASSYTTRLSTYTISGALSFVNGSSAGTTISTTAVTNDSTTLCSGYNTVNGYVARWTDIKGSTFTVKVRQGNPGTKAYGFGMFLLKESTPGPAEPTVTLGLSGSPLAEAGGTATVTATLSAVSTADVTVNLGFAGTATLTTDYTASTNSITIQAGNLSSSITLTAVQDSSYEVPNETIVVDIDSVVNATEDGNQQVSAVIVDDDPEPLGIRFDAVSSASAGAGSTLSWSHTIGTGSNRLLVVGVGTESGASTDALVSGVTYGGQALTKVTGSRAVTLASSTYNATELWYLPAPPVGTATITINFSPSVVNGMDCGAVSLFGAKQEAPEAVAIADNAGSGSTYSLAITTVTDGAWLVDVVNNGTGPGQSFTPGTGMVERWDQNASSVMVCAGATREVATAGTVTDTWSTGGTSRKAQSIAAFAPAPPPAPIAPVVAIVGPTNRALMTADFSIDATATDEDGTVTNVAFYDGTTLLGSDDTSPYTYSVSGARAGAHALSAVAWDNSGMCTTSAVVNVTVRIKQADYAIVISVDGLGGMYLSNMFANSYAIPNFRRLKNEGASTFFAHCDNNNWETLPNHSSIITARPRDGTVGHNWSSNSDPAVGQTLHSNKGSYVASVFDVAHDYGLKTGMYANKSKFSLFDTTPAYPGGGSYNATYGAPDLIGVDNGRDKVDYTYINTTLGGILVDSFIAQQKTTNSMQYAFLHINEPDSYGHSTGWGSATWYTQVGVVDTMLGKLFKLIEQDVPAMKGHTFIILTADHGNQDNPPTGAYRYAVPVFVWGPGVPAGKDLYELNAGTRQVASSYPMTTYAGLQPVRNAEVNNLALGLLGLPPIPGSFFAVSQDLRATLPPVPELPATSFLIEAGVPTFSNVLTEAGYTYWLVYKDNLTDAWTRIGSGWLSDGTVHTFTDPTSPPPVQRFYAVECVSP